MQPTAAYGACSIELTAIRQVLSTRESSAHSKAVCQRASCSAVRRPPSVLTPISDITFVRTRVHAKRSATYVILATGGTLGHTCGVRGRSWSLVAEHTVRLFVRICCLVRSHPATAPTVCVDPRSFRIFEVNFQQWRQLTQLSLPASWPWLSR